MEPIQINALLLVEDEESSHALFVKALDEFFEDSYDMKLFKGVIPLIDFLEELINDPFAIEPSVILLRVDPDVPDPLSTLRELKTNDMFKSYPVIVYSNSDDQGLVNECYDLHVNSFIHRHPDDEHFYQSIQNLLNFWFTVVLPPVTQQDY